MTITGGAQAASIVLSILRMKALALLLGPAGIGLLGIYNSLHTTASSLAGLGLEGAGVRHIAQAKDLNGEIGPLRRVLIVASLLQGLVAMATIWLLRKPIATLLFGDAGFGMEVGLIGVAVLFSLAAASQTALLRGMRRVGDLARVAVSGALAGTVVGLGAVWVLGPQGLIWFVVAQPFTATLIAVWYTRKLARRPATASIGLARAWSLWKPMAGLGFGLMIGVLANAAALLFLQTKIASDLGLDAAGQFAAAWGITMTYVGFMLHAMGMDYYPRLAEIIADRQAAARLMNEQLQIGLLVGGPVLFLLIGLAPVAIALLYSSEFDDAVVLLQWQTAGNILKLASWALSFSIVAAARPALFVLLEASFLVPYIALVFVFLPTFGIEIAGIAFLLSYFLYFLVAHRLAAGISGFRLEQLSFRLILGYGAAAIALLALSLAWPLAGAIASAILCLATGFAGGRVLLERIGPSRITAPLARFYSVCGWPLKERP